jgi:hypothetical protein
MEQAADWKGFPIRLGRAIDRWPGGGQRAFAKALTRHADAHGIVIPTSYRTLVNYLNGRTRPRRAWLAAAADVLGQSPDWLLAGVAESRDGRPDDWAGVQMQVTTAPESAPRALALASFILNGYHDLPSEARLIMWGFAGFFFGHDTAGWDDKESRRADVEDVVRTYFGPLRQPSAAKMGEVEIMALAASLAASAYLQLGPSVLQNKRGIDPADVLADLKRRQPPNELDAADLKRRAAEKEE